MGPAARCSHVYNKRQNPEFETTLPGKRFRLDSKTEMIFGMNVSYTASDIRLKRDVVLLDRLDNGLGLYRYRYLWSEEIYVGVMAQEVAAVAPAAVRAGAGGYLGVDYARLGLRLQTWREWQASRAP
jgi:hypothetical protein